MSFPLKRRPHRHRLLFKCLLQEEAAGNEASLNRILIKRNDDDDDDDALGTKTESPANDRPRGTRRKAVKHLVEHYFSSVDFAVSVQTNPSIAVHDWSKD